MSRFQTTAWSAVLAAARGPDPAVALEGWERLCRTYWRPIYAFIRGWGNNHETAEDLTQDFFHHLLRRERLRDVDRKHGKFRSFLLAALTHFLHSDWDRRIARKRDERVVISLDSVHADGAPSPEPASRETPERLFDRVWAETLYAEVRRKLAQELTARQKDSQLQLLPLALHETERTPYQEMGERLGLTESNVKKIVQRLRKRWGELLRETILATVDDPREVDAELAHLRSILSSGG